MPIFWGLLKSILWTVVLYIQWRNLLLVNQQCWIDVAQCRCLSPSSLFLSQSLILSSLFNIIFSRKDHFCLLCPFLSWFPSSHFLSQCSIFCFSLSVSKHLSSPITYSFFLIFFFHKGIELLYKPVVSFVIHWLQHRTHSDAQMQLQKCMHIHLHIEYTALGSLLYWVLIACVFTLFFDYYFFKTYTAVQFIQAHSHMWPTINTSTLWSYNPHTHMNTFCLPTPTHSLWPIPVGLCRDKYCCTTHAHVHTTLKKGRT